MGCHALPATNLPAPAIKSTSLMSPPLADKFFTPRATCLVTTQIEPLLLYLEELALGNSMSPNNVLGSEPTLGNCISEKTQYRRTELYAGFYSWRTTF